VSKFLQPSGNDYPDAAGKLIDDSATLRGGNRHDGAAYLSGYVVECCLKTILLLERGTVAWVHDLSDLSAQVSKLHSIAGARSAKYVSAPALKHLTGSPILGWRPEIRYRGVGHVSAADAADWVKDANAVYDATIVAMRLDGVI
jgi:HEPN domain-containing protein